MWWLIRNPWCSCTITSYIATTPEERTGLPEDIGENIWEDTWENIREDIEGINYISDINEVINTDVLVAARILNRLIDICQHDSKIKCNKERKYWYEFEENRIISEICG